MEFKLDEEQLAAGVHMPMISGFVEEFVSYLKDLPDGKEVLVWAQNYANIMDQYSALPEKYQHGF